MALLEIIDGPEAGRRLALPADEVISIGRGEHSTYQVTDPHVSRQHLQIGFDRLAGSHYAADYRSANGVLVNDQRIVRPTPLRGGDRITIGGTTLAYHADDAAADQSPSSRIAPADEWKRSTLFRED